MFTNSNGQEEKDAKIDSFFSQKKEETNQELENMGKEVKETKDSVKQALDKHLKDNVIIYSDDEFGEAEGPSTNSVKTVVHKGNGDDTKFVLKWQSLDSTVCEVIAGEFYKAMLYNRSPIFSLIESSDNILYKLQLKSKLLDNFTTLYQFMCDKQKEKLLDLIYEKFADEDGRKELTAYLVSANYNVRMLQFFVNRAAGYAVEDKDFFLNILEKLSKKGICDKLKTLPEFHDIFYQIFEKFKSNREWIKECFLYDLEEAIRRIHKRKVNLLFGLHNYGNKYCEDEIEEIKKLTYFYKSFNVIADKFVTEKLDEKFLNEEIRKAEGIKEQLDNYASQKLNLEVGGLEKIITSMMLLGYADLHACNIGVTTIKHDGAEEKMYAKVDMSASFNNLKYTHYLHYLSVFKCMILNSRAAKESCLKWDSAINYSKLKKEMNKACTLFIDNPDYVESLIHRALFYKTPLLKTDEELELVTNLAKQIIRQAELLKEFANSEEFTHLEEYIASGYDNRIAWMVDANRKIHGKDPIVYAMERTLYITEKKYEVGNYGMRIWYSISEDPLIWAFKNKKKIEGQEPFDWIKTNRSSPFLQEWLKKHSITDLDDFQNHDDLIKYCDDFTEKIKHHARFKQKNKDTDIIKRITKVVQANLEPKKFEPPQQKSTVTKLQQNEPQASSNEPQASSYDNNTSMYYALGAAGTGFLAMGVILCAVGMPEIGGIFIASAVICALIVVIGKAYENVSEKKQKVPDVSTYADVKTIENKFASYQEK